MQKNNYISVFTITAVISILLIILGSFGFLNFPSSFLSSIFSKPREILIASINKNSPNNNLQNQEFDKLKKENQALRDQFAASNPSTQTLLPSHVIGSPTFIPGETLPDELILDKGEKDGVKKGDGVVIQDNLIGIIQNTNNFSSRAILVNNSTVSITGKLEDESVGVVRGDGTSIKIGNILLSENLVKGQSVFTKGSQDVNLVGIPPGLVIGQIASVNKKSSDLFQEAEIKSNVDFTKLFMVFIVVK